jgi:AcrR family transcriptional regulator
VAARARSSGGGAQRGLTREGIVTAALRLIDDGGLQAFSMRRLGAALGVDASAVYWHLHGQEELFEAIAEALVDEVDLDALPWDGPWQEFLGAYGTGLYEVLLRHPHAVVIFASRTVRSPSAVRAADHGVTRMVADGFTPGEAVQAAFALRAFTVGAALDAVARAVVGLPPAERSQPPSDNLLAQGVAAAGDYFPTGLAALIRGLRPGDR